MINMNAQDVVNEMVDSVVLIIIAGLFIYILLVFGNAVGPQLGGAAAQSTINYGILAIGAIVTVSGLAGLIKFAQWIRAYVERSETFRGSGV